MKTLLRDATVIPMTQHDLYFVGSVGIDGSKIAFIGEQPADFAADETIDATGMIALPGLVNAHTHLSMVYFRNYKDTVENLQDWLSEIWPLEDKLIATDTYPASQLGITEMISSGTTCFSDMYFSPEGTCRAVYESGIKANLGITLFSDLSDSKTCVADGLPIMEDYASKSGNRIRYDIAPHAVFTCTADSYRYAVDFAREHHCRLNTHLCETRKEVDDCIATHGHSPVEYLQSLGVFDVDTYLAHCVHLDSRDLDILAHTGTTVVHNPSSNCKLASGIAPVARMRQAGISLALGTDGAASNNSLDLFQEIRLAGMISAVSTGNPVALKAYDILYMATAGGAQALGRLQECGTLEVGKDADIILIDTHTPHLTPLNNPFSALVYAAKSTDVDTVFCQGRKLMDHRVLLTIDEEAVLRTADSIWRNIIART